MKDSRPRQISNLPKLTLRSLVNAGLESGLDSRIRLLLCGLIKSSCVTLWVQTHWSLQEGRLPEPACPPATGLCSVPLSGFGLNPWVLFPTFPEGQAQVENITMVTLVSEGQPSASGKHDTLVPNTECSVGLRDEFNWHRSQLARRTCFSALCPRCGIQDTRKHDVFAPREEGEREPGVSSALAPGCLMRGAGRAAALAGLWGHLGCVLPVSPNEGPLGCVAPASQMHVASRDRPLCHVESHVPPAPSRQGREGCH